jgi:hypothetical protein
MIRLTDIEIERLLTERKILPANYRELLQLTPKRGHREQNLNIDGTAGSAFRLILRQSLANPLDFSVILGYRGLPRLFLLRRYDGKSHFHTNRLERQRFYDFHIHIATQRYQEAGLEEDGFAQPSDSFTDFHSALRCLLTDCHFEWPQDPQGTLFSEFGTL